VAETVVMALLLPVRQSVPSLDVLRRPQRDLLPQLRALRESLPEQSSSAVETIQTIRLQAQRPGWVRARPRD
jgi:hypothetical protein